jgi:hypothetical protein
LCRRIPQPNSAQLQEPLSEVQRRRTCLPKHLWETAIEYVHERTAHQGAAATTEKLRNAFFFPFMKKEVAEMVEACEACQMKMCRGANDQRHTYATTSREGYPFQRLNIDLVGPFPMSPEGYTHLLTVNCTFSKWLEAFPLKDEKATLVVEVLEREMFCCYGPPESIHSDNGCQFTSCLLKEVGAELGITLTTTPPYNPKSNPVERSHRDLGEALRALLKNEPADDWYKFLPQVLYAMHTRTCAVTKMTPYKLVFGRDPAQPLDLIFGRPPDRHDREPERYVLEMRKRLDAAQSWARTNIRKYIRRKEWRYNAERKVFQAGLKVWLFTPVVDSSTKRKLSNYPWTVVKKLTDKLYRIAPHNEWQTWMRIQVVEINRLKLYRE